MVKPLLAILLLIGVVSLLGAQAAGQPPESRASDRSASEGRAAPSDGSRSAGESSLVERMLRFDADHDERLTKEEVTDGRLHRLLDRADADHDGRVTRQELTSLATKEQQEEAERGGFGAGDFGPGGFGPDDFGPRGGFPPGGPGGPRGDRGRGEFGRGGPPAMSPPGQVLDRFLRDRLHLSDEQNRQLDELQQEVDAKLAKILTAEQRDELQQLQRRGPGGFRDRPGPRPTGPRDFER